MKIDKDVQMRHAGICVWPQLAVRRAEDILRVQTRLQQYGYDGCIATLSADAIIQGWKRAGWIAVAPNGFQMRLTTEGKEQLAQWHEEDRLWRCGSEKEIEIPKRLKAGEPATNLRRIHAVIGNRQITGIHDPYTDIKALETLLKLSGLGVQMDARLRLLGTPAKNMSLLKVAAKFLRDDINAQYQWQWEMRTYITKERPHRRFLVCADGGVITCGLSLNNLNKDEALDSIPASDELAKHDCHFFEEKWKLGTPI